MRIELTTNSIKALKAPTDSGKQEIAWDSELPGFGLLLCGKTTRRPSSPSGTSAAVPGA